MIIKKFIILDTKNRSSALFEFSEKANIISSKKINTGKSSLLKSLYYTLGLDIATFPDGWDYENLWFKIYYSHKNQQGYIIRTGDTFFVENVGRLDIKEYAEWLAGLLGINLKLFRIIKDSGEVIASLRVPAYAFPFYIDQDESWSSSSINYKSTYIDTSIYFEHFPYRSMEYLLGLSDDKLQDFELDLFNLKLKKKKLNIKRKLLQELKEEFVKEVEYNLDFDEDKIKQEIKNYLLESENLVNSITRKKNAIYKDRKQLDFLIIEKKELDKLKEKNTHIYKQIDHSECPLCESILTIEQSIKRIITKNNIDDIKTLLLNNKHEIVIVETKLEEKQLKFIEDEKKIQQLKELASIKSGELTLQKYIEEKSKIYNSENYSIAFNKLILDINNNEIEINLLEEDIKRHQANLEIHKNNVKQEFKKLKNELQISMPDTIIVKQKFLNFYKLKNISGSAKNQTILAFYLIYLTLILKYSKIEIPFGIDAILKEEADDLSLINMYKQLDKYIISKDIQSFSVALEDKLQHIKSEYRLIELTKPILSKENYKNLLSEFDTIL